MEMASGRDIIVVAASAGGLLPLRRMLSQLPPDLPAAVLTVLHIPATGGRSLPRILDRAGPLTADSAVDGERIQPRRVYVAPPDRHLLVVKDMVRLSRGPRQNGVRPAADPLFRSAALHAGPRTTAVVLSGTMDDAALGSATVERRGGRVVVQDPADADYDSMPRSAIAATGDAIVVPAAGLAGQVTRLATQEAAMAPADAFSPDEELAAELDGLLADTLEASADPHDYSRLSCPDCGGLLYHASGNPAGAYECLAGHRWSPQSLFEEHSTSVERALWLAIRSLEERDGLTAGLAEAARRRGYEISARQFAKASEEARQAANIMREVANGMSTEVAQEPEQA
jgi:two-component system, chemotaxis family, protein-glutamate methylesterase/glutaminase